MVPDKSASTVLPQEHGRGAASDEPAAVDGGDLVDGLTQLGQLVAGDQHRAALVGEAAKQVPHSPERRLT
jgi:hypothetical protein